MRDDGDGDTERAKAAVECWCYILGLDADTTTQILKFLHKTKLNCIVKFIKKIVTNGHSS